jgi:hypothetical protein
MSEAPRPKLTTLQALRPDPQNARRRTQRSYSLLEYSLQEFGAARSVVIDEEGTIIAGNGTVEAAASVGIDRVLVVPTDGHTLVAVQRTDLDPTQKAALGLADNRSSDLSEIDGQALLGLMEALPDLDVSPMFVDEEIKALAEIAGLDPIEEEDTGQGAGDGDPTVSSEMKLSFRGEQELLLFQQSLLQLARALPQLKTTEQRLQFVLDQFLSGPEQ